MNASNVVPASRRYVYACADCGVEILQAGGAYAPITQIAYGQICEVHGPNRPDMPASHAVVPSPTWARPLPVDELVDDAPTIAYRGTLTKITADLVIAWSREEKHADETMVGAAAHVARLILKATNGD